MKKSLVVAALLLLVFPVVLRAQIPVRTNGAQPCCGITAIDAANGLVTARDAATGRTFQFEVDSRALLGSLRVGQRVWLSAARDRVSLDNGEPCCNIVGAVDLGTSVDVQPDASEPCCGIIAVDAARGLATARDLSTGRTFQFAAPNAGAVRAGDRVAADLAAGRVTSAAGIPGASATLEPAYGDPCCGVVSIEPDPADPCCSIVSVTNTATGQAARFSAPMEVARGLAAGDPVWADAIGGFAVIQTAVAAGRSATYSFPLQVTGGGAWSSTASAATSASEHPSWTLTPNPALRGAMGRLVLTVPGDDASVLFHILRAGTDDRLDTWYGADAGSFLPGRYDIGLWEARITDVPVERGMDTQVRAGVLSVTFEGSYTLLDESGERVVNAVGNEKRKVLVPPGRYRMELRTGQGAVVTITDGQITEF